MKRFTEKHYHGIDHYLLCSADCHADMDCVDCPAFENAVERLAAYEDTGLEPEQVEVLQKQLCCEILDAPAGIAGGRRTEG